MMKMNQETKMIEGREIVYLAPYPGDASGDDEIDLLELRRIIWQVRLVVKHQLNAAIGMLRHGERQAQGESASMSPA